MSDTVKNVIKVILIIVAVVAVGVGALVFLLSASRPASYYITTESSWQTLNKDEISIRMPARMKEVQALAYSGTTAICAYHNDDCVIYISKRVLSADEQKEIKVAKDMKKLYKSATRTVKIEGEKLKPEMSGSMVYVKYNKKSLILQDGVESRAITGNFLSNGTLYSVEVACKRELFDQYEPYMMKWLQSFHVSGA